MLNSTEKIAKKARDEIKLKLENIFGAGSVWGLYHPKTSYELEPRLERRFEAGEFPNGIEFPEKFHIETKNLPRGSEINAVKLTINNLLRIPYPSISIGPVERESGLSKTTAITLPYSPFASIITTDRLKTFTLEKLKEGIDETERQILSNLKRVTGVEWQKKGDDQSGLFLGYKVDVQSLADLLNKENLDISKTGLKSLSRIVSISPSKPQDGLSLGLERIDHMALDKLKQAAPLKLFTEKDQSQIYKKEKNTDAQFFSVEQIELLNRMMGNIWQASGNRGSVRTKYPPKAPDRAFSEIIYVFNDVSKDQDGNITIGKISESELTQFKNSDFVKLKRLSLAFNPDMDRHSHRFHFTY